MPRASRPRLAARRALHGLAGALASLTLACEMPALCDLDGDGLCAPADCDDYDPAVSVCAGTPSPSEVTPTLPARDLPLFPGHTVFAVDIPDRVQSSKKQESLGADVAAIGDADGDGYDDLLVGAYTWWQTDSDSAEGAAYLIYGPVEGEVSLSDLPQSGRALRWRGVEASGAVGYAVAAMDVDGDGDRDALLGAPAVWSSELPGAVHVMLAPFGDRGSDLSIGAGGFTIRGEHPGDDAGFAVASAGDLDGDGAEDLVVGAPDAQGTGVAGDGVAYVFYGPLDPAAPPASLTDADVTLLGNGGEGVGWDVVSAGDFDGDGYGDLLLSAWRHGSIEAPLSGAAYLLYGPLPRGKHKLSSAGEELRRVMFLGAQPGDVSGRAIAHAGDIDQDGLSDLLISAEGDDWADTRTSEGSVYLVLGQQGLTGQVELEKVQEQYDGMHFTSEYAGARTGEDLAGVGDLDGDGSPDFVLSAPHEDETNAGLEYGAVYVLYGHSRMDAWGEGYLSQCAGRVFGEHAYDSIGYAVAGVGDVDADGFPDIAFSALTGRTGGDVEEFVHWDGLLYVVHGWPGISAVRDAPPEP